MKGFQLPLTDPKLCKSSQHVSRMLNRLVIVRARLAEIACLRKVIKNVSRGQIWHKAAIEKITGTMSYRRQSNCTDRSSSNQKETTANLRNSKGRRCDNFGVNRISQIFQTGYNLPQQAPSVDCGQIWDILKENSLRREFCSKPDEIEYEAGALVLAPPRFPTILNGWHGGPPTRTSIRETPAISSSALPVERERSVTKP